MLLCLVVVPFEALAMLLGQAELFVVTLMRLRPFAVHAMVLLMVPGILPLVPWNLGRSLQCMWCFCSRSLRSWSLCS